MNKKGFTLVELMVVLAILGLLAGIGIPSYMTVLNRAKIGTDIAAIAQVQTTVNAFIAETGGWTSGETQLAEPPVNDGTPAEVDIDVTGTSIITGDPVALSSFFTDATLPLLKSDDGAGNAWVIDAAGKVFIAVRAGEGTVASPYTYTAKLP